MKERQQEIWTSKHHYERICDLAQVKGMTIAQLAIFADLNESTIYKMRDRGAIPSSLTVAKICDALGITIAEYYSSEHEKKLHKNRLAVLDLFALKIAHHILKATYETKDIQTLEKDIQSLEDTLNRENLL